MTKQSVRAEDDPYYRLWMDAIGEPIQGPKIRSDKSITMSLAQLAAQNRPDVKAKLCASQRAAQARPETKAKHSAALSLPCTIDGGKTVYPSRIAMAKAIGRGKRGVGSPNFQYLPKGTSSNALITTAIPVAPGTPCTIDGGKTVYASGRAMESALGKSKNGGVRSPNFQWLPKGTPSNA